MRKFIVFMVVALGITGAVVFYQKCQQERRKQAEAARQQERQRREKEKAEAARLAAEEREAVRKHNEEVRRKREEARAKALQEQQAAKARREQEKKEAEEQAKNARRDVCAKILSALNGAELRPWRTAGDEDRPERVKTEKTFHCLLPDGEGGRMILEQKLDFGRTVSVRRVDSEKENENFEPESFERTVSAFPNLLVSGDRVFFRPTHPEPDPCPVPAPGEAFDPAEHDFGLAYDLVKGTGAKTSAFVYDVFFQPFGSEQNAVLVATVPFGGTVAFEVFRAKVGAWAKRNRALVQKSQKKAPPQKVWKPSYVFTDKTVVKKRVDGVTEVPRTYVPRSNKHRYLVGSREYENELKKEEVAQQKWQALFKKAEADEAKAKALKEESAGKQSGGTGDAVLDAGTVVYRLHEEPAK